MTSKSALEDMSRTGPNGPNGPNRSQSSPLERLLARSAAKTAATPTKPPLGASPADLAANRPARRATGPIGAAAERESLPPVKSAPHARVVHPAELAQQLAEAEQIRTDFRAWLNSPD